MSVKVFEIVTQRITDLLESGTIPWRKPWKGGTLAPCNIAGYKYNGINFFLLSCLGYSTPVYLSFNQIKTMGGRIKAGEEKKHAPVFFWKWLDIKDKNSGDDKKIPMCRYSLVWNIDQVEGVKLPKKFAPVDNIVANHDPIAMAESVVEGYANRPEIRVVKDSDRACYTPVIDIVSMPDKNQFSNVEEYYSTLFHELTHSTGHAKRLNRKELMDAGFFGSHDYSVEELCAEMGAAYLCAHAGINNTLENSASYIAGWLKRLKSDSRMLMTAAARAQKAFTHIVGVPEVEEND